MNAETQARALIAGKNAKAALRLTPPQADFISCLMTAVLASLPTFLAAFMDCLSSGPGPGADNHQPGSRDRC